MLTIFQLNSRQSGKQTAEEATKKKEKKEEKKKEEEEGNDGEKEEELRTNWGWGCGWRSKRAEWLNILAIAIHAQKSKLKRKLCKFLPSQV